MVCGVLCWRDLKEELFPALKDHLRIEPERVALVELEEREMFLVPRCASHNPMVEQECLLLLIEHKSTLHTGNDRDGAAWCRMILRPDMG